MNVRPSRLSSQRQTLLVILTGFLVLPEQIVRVRYIAEVVGDLPLRTELSCDLECLPVILDSLGVFP